MKLFDFENNYLNTLFPFHFVLDTNLIIVQAGQSLKKICPEIINSTFQSYFNFKRPQHGIKYDFVSISSFANQVFILELKSKHSPLFFRGQIIFSNNYLFFAGSPWITDADDLDTHNLLLTDFSLHDPVTDMIQLLKVRQFAYDDIESLANNLKVERDKLVEQNKKIEDLAKFPAENPNPILRISLSGKVRYVNAAATFILKELNFNLNDSLPELLKNQFVQVLELDQKLETDIVINNREFHFVFVPFVESGYVNVYGTDITDRRKAEKLVEENEKQLRTQYAIVELLSTSMNSIEVTICKAIETFCFQTEWVCGAFWIPENEILVCSSFWQTNLIKDQSFESITKEIKFRKSEGLPGRVWAEGKGVWLNGLSLDSNFPRKECAIKVGFNGAFAHPIFFNGQFLGVIEFFSNSMSEPKPHTMAMFEVSAKQIGQFIIRKKSEELLKDSEEKYKQLVEEADDIIYKADQSGYFTYANSVCARIMKIDPSKVIGKHFSELVRVDWREKTASFYFKQFKNKTPITYFEFPAVDGNNKEIWLGQKVKLIENNGMVVGFQAVARDVSEKIKAQVELSKNEEKYRGILENLDLGILEVDLKGTITKVYDKYCQLTGYTKEELLGKNAGEILLIKEDYKTQLINESNNRINGKSSVYEIAITCKDGIEKWVLISGSPIYSQDGIVVGSIGIHLDITERKESEEQLLFAKQAAEHSQKVKEEFLANMSHEIRTPMNGILGMSKLLDSANLSTKHREYLKSIQTSANNLLVIINDILDLSKMEAGKLDLERIGFKLSFALKSAIETVNYLAVEKDLFITIQLEEKLNDLIIIGDPTRLNQILTNLLNNAIKFTSIGEIKLECKLLEAFDNKLDLQFSVSDGGIGIAKDKLENIFESFNQADSSTTRRFGGTGLGLSICKTLVEMQGGMIIAESELNVGTKFTFNIPFAVGSENDLPSQLELISEVDFKEIKLLLVEDHKVNQVYAASILESCNIVVEIAENGLEAVNKLKNNTYNIVLMDIQMPIMGGVEATQIIRNELKLDIPIIALTANAIAGEREKYIKAGMNAFVSKPFKDTELINVISKVLNHNARLPFNKIETIAFSEKSTSDDLTELYSLDKIREMSRGNEAFVDKLVALFKEETDKALVILNEAFENKDYTKVKGIAHKIKPSVNMMGITSIKDDIQAIEDFTPENMSQEKLKELISKVSSICQKVISDL